MQSIEPSFIAVRDELRQSHPGSEYAALVDPHKRSIQDIQRRTGKSDVEAARAIVDEILAAGGATSVIPCVLAALVDLREESAPGPPRID